MSREESPIQSAAKDVYDMLLRSQAFEATQLADELYADAIGQWRRVGDAASVVDLLVAACALAEAQAAAGRLKPAINTVLRAVTEVSRVDEAERGGVAAPDVAAEQMMMCYLTMWSSLEQLLTLASPDGEAMRVAVADATCHLGSLLYHYYYATGRVSPDCAVLHDAYEALRVITSLVSINPGAATADSLRSLAACLAAANLTQ